ncbi:DNA repair protein recN [Sulfurimonas gotlandica GD1]|uniref:DNA repair protein RecN n=1 Tax=Sulfurimonas gotlandica (strain DSM 19862 / JCM 16533 / GD1) TaxID=929558 RepID=B6BJH9_SULGG|nr:AAA family ATPase [Sulfurimonas gotlandica]EDZ62484.1 ATPase [Sulfurimonas gotlandica GD1]EHP31225.1 DNA repair protein recN [Sulfurimonas gotlandica GD1]
MIERFYLKDYLSFREIELNPTAGLVVFTGPSGSGKSILMKSILSSLGAESCEASLCESSVTWEINSADTGIENDDINIFKHIKKDKSRYFINNQSVSKKAISGLSSNYLRHLSLKDFSDFENENLISILDTRIQNKSKDIYNIKDEYKKLFIEHREVRVELNQIEEEERKIVELKEFATFEINKIQEIDPKVSEDEELLEIKKELSRKEKVLETISLANSIFDNEHSVNSALDSLDADSSFFDDTMNELRALFDSAEAKFNALEDVDIEEVLNRIEELSGLKRRYGSIEEALAYKEQKIIELAKYENIEITKDELVKREAALSSEVKKLSNLLTALREEELKSFNDDLNRYLEELYLRNAKVTMQDSEMCDYGKDEILVKLNNTELQKVSTGEFNRLRLAILAMKSEFMSQNGGVLMLDEIDANLSGEESMSVAKVLRQLSKHFQIFVISHQPQLTSMGEQHFLVHKSGDESMVKELSFDDRVDEIARIISGDSVSNEAKSFAKELLEASR